MRRAAARDRCPRCSAVLPASLQPSAALRGSQLHPPSPQEKLSATLSELGLESIVALSLSCSEDLDVKFREETDLAKLLADLKRKKTQYDARIARKRREVDSSIVQNMEMERELQAFVGSNKVVSAKVAGMGLENERLAAEVEHLRRGLKEASASYEKECLAVEKLKQMLFTYREETGAGAKQRGGVQQELRASRTAQKVCLLFLTLRKLWIFLITDLAMCEVPRQGELQSITNLVSIGQSCLEPMVNVSAGADLMSGTAAIRRRMGSKGVSMGLVNGNAAILELVGSVPCAVTVHLAPGMQWAGACSSTQLARKL